MPKRKLFASKNISGKAKPLTNSALGLLQAVAVFGGFLILVATIDRGVSFFQKLDGASGTLFMFNLLILTFIWEFLALFGYPIILLADKKVLKALEILAYTFFWLLALVLVLVVVVSNG
ncbi:hypothetical protein HYV44_01990 [Candidatus Microgenomates bacterium]|nr:hypothetical protein [Candidatus Microgenomates bacterium]